MGNRTKKANSLDAQPAFWQAPWRGVFFAAASLLLATASGCGREAVEDSGTVMEIAGYPVVKAEYQMVLRQYDAGVKGNYTTEEANREDFWTMDLEGGRPLKQVMELAKEDLTHKKVVAKLAKDAGIPGEPDYLTLAGQMEKEERETGMQAGDVTYGPTSRTLEDYYTYVYTDLEAKLMESLKGTYQVPEEELRQQYQENLEQYTSDVSVRMLVGEAEAGTGLEQEEQAVEDLAGEVSMEALAEKYPDISFYELEMSSLNMEEGKSGVYMQRWLTASSMEEGQVCEPFQIGGHWLVMRCLQRKEQAVEPFEDIKGTLEGEVRTRLAREELERNIQEAKVSFREEILEQAALEALGAN